MVGASVLGIGVLTITSYLFIVDGNPRCKVKIGDSEFLGERKTSWNGKSYCSFYGVPYVKAPKRFEPSELQKVDWSGERLFTKKPPNCLQIDFEKNELVGEEDCLYLDIHTTLEESNAPVIFWVHGGSFNFGSGDNDIIEPDSLIERGIVVITINYRLGPFGFFALQATDVERNLGLKDQVEALKWTREYINYFGGNSKDVTLAGWSAGGAAVTYHLYSKLSQGLFQKAISMSGTHIAPWAFKFDTDKCGESWCTFFNVTCGDSNNLELLQQTEVTKDIFHRPEVFFFHFSQPYACFLPTTEGKSANNVFLVEQAHNLTETELINDVPLLIGYTNLEELCLDAFPNQYVTINTTFPYNREDVHKFLEKFVESSLASNQKAKYLELRRIADTIYSVVDFANTYSKISKSPTYVYKFSLSRKKADNPTYCLEDSEEGAFHGDDIKLLFAPYLQVWDIFDRNVDKTKNAMADMLASFIKQGNPTPDNTGLPKLPEYDNEKWLIDINEAISIQQFKPSKMFELWSVVYDCLYFANCKTFEEMVPTLSKAEIQNLNDAPEN